MKNEWVKMRNMQRIVNDQKQFVAYFVESDKTASLTVLFLEEFQFTYPNVRNCFNELLKIDFDKLRDESVVRFRDFIRLTLIEKMMDDLTNPKGVC